MGYIRIKGIPGLVYEPDSRSTPKKHECEDCFACQWCGETRCTCCRKTKRKHKKPREQ